MKRSINRREFIKRLSYALLGMIVVRLKNFSEFFNSNKTSDPALKEAKYYSQADHLAG